MGKIVRHRCLKAKSSLKVSSEHPLVNVKIISGQRKHLRILEKRTAEKAVGYLSKTIQKTAWNTMPVPKEQVIGDTCPKNINQKIKKIMGNNKFFT